MRNGNERVKWSDWLELDVKRFERRLRRRLSRPITHNDFIALYNELIALAGQKPRKVSALSKSIANLLSMRARVRDALLFWELNARTSATSGDFGGTFDALRRMTDLDSGDATREIVLELAEAAAEEPDRFGLSLDQQPRVFAAVSEVFQRYGLLEQVARLHLRAAEMYSKHGASQAAYRSIVDAENIAHETGSQRLLAEVYGVATSTACEEGDHEWAVGAAKRALSAWKIIGEAPPAGLLSNLGVARMRLEQYEDAATDLRAALAAADDEFLASTIRINLAACLRAGGDLNGAWNAAREARKGLAADCDPERHLELALVTARIASERQETGVLADNLAEASHFLDLVLGNILRLHHRRGIRKRYVARIEGLLRGLPSVGPVDQALLPIAAIRSNALGDWLSILDWADTVGVDARVDPSDRAEVASTISALRNFGAPHLYGHREKYDDAWSVMDGGSAWDKLSSLAARIEATGLNQPISNAMLKPVMKRCRRRLEEGHCLMALSYAGHSAILWSFIGDRYSNAHLPLDTLKKWKVAVLAHASAEIDRTEFDGQIVEILDEIWPEVMPLLNSVADAGVRSIRFIQDFGDSLPLTAITMRHKVLAARMAAGEFHVRIVPALHNSHEESLSNPSVVAITDVTEDLLLPDFEGCALASVVEASDFRHVDAADKADLPDLLGHADILLISTHASPLQIYTDPFFARMGAPEGRHLIGVEALQMFGPDLRASLVLLNACHSGTGSARNFHHRFRTSDLVTYPALLTLNRRATISAGAWKTSDTVAYLHTWMVADALRAGHTVPYAIGVAIGCLPQLTRSLAIEMLDGIPDPSVREAAVARLAGAPEYGLFNQPYVSGGIAVHGLL
jgi:tetratricopeptide (TPR) repeat protein